MGCREHCFCYRQKSIYLFCFKTRYPGCYRSKYRVIYLRFTAAFGAEINVPLLGYVIPLSSFTVSCSNDSLSGFPTNTGCPTLCIHGPNAPDASELWIALVQRGECEFVSKVREAQRLGARAVVVGGNDPEVSGYPDTLVNMYSPGKFLSYASITDYSFFGLLEDASDINIAATFIRFSDYVQLSSLIQASNTSHAGLRTLSLLITAEYSAWEWYSYVLFLPVSTLLSTLRSWSSPSTICIDASIIFPGL